MTVPFRWHLGHTRSSTNPQPPCRYGRRNSRNRSGLIGNRTLTPSLNANRSKSFRVSCGDLVGRNDLACHLVCAHPWPVRVGLESPAPPGRERQASQSGRTFLLASDSPSKLTRLLAIRVTSLATRDRAFYEDARTAELRLERTRFAKMTASHRRWFEHALPANHASCCRLGGISKLPHSVQKLSDLVPSRDALGRRTRLRGEAESSDDARPTCFSSNLVEAGMIDPTNGVRSALQNAASVATLLLTTEAVISQMA